MDVLQAYLWWCGDDVCDCTQYVIDRTTPHPVTRGFVTRERIWEGEFVSNSSEQERSEKAERLLAFRKAAHGAGIKLTRESSFYNFHGERAD